MFVQKYTVNIIVGMYCGITSCMVGSAKLDFHLYFLVVRLINCE